MGTATPSPPDWFSLLRYQREAKRLTGLTIPFLVGAAFESCRPDALEEQALYAELNALLLSFRDATPASHCVIIAECTTLYEPVAALYPSIARREDCEGLADSSGVAVRLYVQHGYFRRKEWSLASAIGWLWDRFGETLVRGEFSFHKAEDASHGEYAGFDAKDREYLEKARRWHASSGTR